MGVEEPAWEAPEYRVVVPVATKAKLGITDDVLPRSSSNYEETLTGHSYDLKYIDDPTRWSAGSQLVGNDSREGRELDLIALTRDGDCWIKIVIGFNNKSDRHQMVTLYATGRVKKIRKWKRQIVPIEGE